MAEDLDIECLNRVSTKRLAAMAVGETQVFSESEGTKTAGSQTQCYAIRAGVKVATRVCLVVIPTTATTVKALLVTRIE